MKRPEPGTITRKRAIIGRGQPPSKVGKPLAVLYVSSRAPFMSLVNRAIKVLDKGPGGARWSATKVLPLQDRVDAAQRAAGDDAADAKRRAAPRSLREWRATRQREVVLLATGHAIERLTLVAAWFRRQEGYVVGLRTRWSSTIDDLFFPPGSGEAPADAKPESADRPDTVMDDETDADGKQAGGGVPLAEHKENESLRHDTRLRNVSCLEVSIRLK
ncbi:hypothetical protein SPI_05392 [Niveomyces insectorum RCEF 264]|uniref:Uncharacterized protein n=1 Tax=Niveomyces insectorum RCEF 264 TaxID=1081102 RepID=A0A167T672_9HYPO|nr:hypothetical protein SPI_05392 [Niveomyces insectorum RCEF 264]